MHNTVRTYRPDIDGLRALAVTSVVFFHGQVPFFDGGFVGVDIFFVISGYLICGHIFTESLAGTFTYGSFYARRARRILPALLFVTCTVFVASLLLLSPRELVRFSQSAISGLFGASNVYYYATSNYFAPSSEQLPMLMTWSLGIEEQFYLFFPLILLPLVKYVRSHVFHAIAALSVLSFLSALVLIHFDPAATFYLLPSRAWELGVGGLLAIAQVEGRPFLKVLERHSHLAAALAATLLFVPIFLIDETMPFPGWIALAPVLGATLAIATPSSWLSRLLSVRPVVFVGLASYSWYLWHWPMLSLARISAVKGIDNSAAYTIVALSLILAVATLYGIERPFRSSSGRDVSKLWRYGIALGLAASVFGIAIVGRGFPNRFPSQVARTESAATRSEPCLLPYGATALPSAATCMPKATSGTIVALVGDSHAAALAPGLRQLGAKKGIEVYVMTKSSCPPLIDATRYMPNHPRHAEECARFNHGLMQFLSDRPEISTVVLAGNWSAPFLEEERGSRYIKPGVDPAVVTPQESEKIFRSALQSTVGYLEAKGRKIILVQDVPVFPIDPIRWLLRNNTPYRRLLGDLVSRETGIIYDSVPIGEIDNLGDTGRVTLKQYALKNPSASLELVDGAAPFCGGNRCRFADQFGLPYFIDSQHLSGIGSNVVAKSIFR